MSLLFSLRKCLFSQINCRGKRLRYNLTIKHEQFSSLIISDMLCINLISVLISKNIENCWRRIAPKFIISGTRWNMFFMYINVRIEFNLSQVTKFNYHINIIRIKSLIYQKMHVFHISHILLWEKFLSKRCHCESAFVCLCKRSPPKQYILIYSSCRLLIIFFPINL